MRLLGLDLSSTTFLSFLSTSILLRQGLSMHCCVFKLGLLNTYDHIPLANAVMSMYIRYGQVHEARAILDSMHEISVVSWSTIIGGYVNTGNVDEAFSMFNIMRTISTINSDFVVFINLIKGCAKRGSLLEASSLHSLIFKCGCENKDPLDNLLLGMYAKCGDLISARKVFDMANAKTVFLWTSIISGHGNYVLMANLYTSMGKWKEAAVTRSLMIDRGLIKAPGWSQIEISSSVNVFIAGDRSHTQSIDIYKLLEDINLKLAEAGYVPETDTVKH
ncbi:PPR CONTAINING PLANT-LIKE PROTEIN [Salix koriyanagi]|uniref:PPR CONTAINING PLANT-LIKE PROTEIN n=1 Tax=Salix koriyanagi TaxID=2511006 RepID=A0A9Q0W1U3_9ROSI|nr:PPR CONTAINING PLANT-LIKE PROTEIN [Salix koriyanagi]